MHLAALGLGLLFGSVREFLGWLEGLQLENHPMLPCKQTCLEAWRALLLSARRIWEYFYSILCDNHERLAVPASKWPRAAARPARSHSACAAPECNGRVARS